MSIQAVLLPLFVEVALTFACCSGWRGRASPRSRAGKSKWRDVALGQPNWPPRVQQIANSYHNQFQLPVLFYVLTVLAIITSHADLLFVVLAWLFVLSRLVHAYIHTSTQLCPASLQRLRGRRVHSAGDVGDLRGAHPARPAMTPAARLAAAIEVFGNIESERRPAADALKSWGLAHRFRRLRRPRRHCRAGLRRAAPARLERLHHGRRHAARDPARHAQARARARQRRDRQTGRAARNTRRRR